MSQSDQPEPRWEAGGTDHSVKERGCWQRWVESWGEVHTSPRFGLDPADFPEPLRVWGWDKGHRL